MFVDQERPCHRLYNRLAYGIDHLKTMGAMTLNNALIRR